MARRTRRRAGRSAPSGPLGAVRQFAGKAGGFVSGFLSEGRSRSGKGRGRGRASGRRRR